MTDYRAERTLLHSAGVMWLGPVDVRACPAPLCRVYEHSARASNALALPIAWVSRIRRASHPAPTRARERIAALAQLVMRNEFSVAPPIERLANNYTSRDGIQGLFTLMTGQPHA